MRHVDTLYTSEAINNDDNNNNADDNMRNL